MENAGKLTQFMGVAGIPSDNQISTSEPFEAGARNGSDLIPEDVDLSNPMDSINTNSPMFRYNWKIMIPPGVSSLLLLADILDATRVAQTDASDDILHTAHFCLCVPILLMCVGLLLWGRFRSGGYDNYFDNLQLIFGIWTTDDMYEVLEVRYLTFCVLCCTVYTCTATMAYYLAGLAHCRHQARDGCVVFYATYGSPVLFGMSLLYFLRLRTVQCADGAAEVKSRILKRYGKSTQRLDGNVQSAIQKWKKRKKLSSRPRQLELSILFVLLLVLVLVLRFLSHNHRLGVDRHAPQIWLLCIMIYLCDALFLTVIYGTGHTLLWHVRFPALIVNTLSTPINALDVDDILGWWELRKFYMCCIVEPYSSPIRISIATAMFGFSFFSLLLVRSPGEDYSRLELRLVIAFQAMYLTVGAFLVVHSTVSYHTNLMLHTATLNREKMRLNRCEMKVAEQQGASEWKGRKTQEIIDNVLLDVASNSDAISVLGVRMNHNFLLFLRGSVVSVLVAYVIENY